MALTSHQRTAISHRHSIPHLIPNIVRVQMLLTPSILHLSPKYKHRPSNKRCCMSLTCRTRSFRNSPPALPPNKYTSPECSAHDSPRRGNNLYPSTRLSLHILPPLFCPAALVIDDLSKLSPPNVPLLVVLCLYGLLDIPLKLVLPPISPILIPIAPLLPPPTPLIMLSPLLPLPILSLLPPPTPPSRLNPFLSSINPVVDL
ncbi:hypothetical protein AX774_g2036 [Zancudomyces culisetae]|uniref:Uncharacterized protein n=1 Tax=Zancudomyces culisetae TaxID=1213189 RepID=A0A1R1PU13_ZANCU|nr:hypothetical protein AX774_g2036 [Zancudomyces culisetae]|eukprot:OMH84437.1 hypothetical protein AX774_g2036 [Zancudomyces culisetae]